VYDVQSGVHRAPLFVIRYRQMREVASDALLTTNGALSLELCAVIGFVAEEAQARQSR
jgi:hypothetical protein